MGTRHGSFSLALILVIIVPLMKCVDSKCVFFNFGDSNSDNGGLMAGLGLYLGPPAGRTFFNRTTGRFCDGRLYIDFICISSHLNFNFSVCCFDLVKFHLRPLKEYLSYFKKHKMLILVHKNFIHFMQNGSQFLLHCTT